MRIVLVVPTAWLLVGGRYVQALVLMSIAGASDAVDGWLARRLNAVSRFGAALDPVADKLLVAAMFVIFAVQAHLPLWLAVIVLGRDLVILSGAGVYRLLFGASSSRRPTSARPTRRCRSRGLLLLLWLCEFGW
jgi:cardiolipin synthase (CMP-forming)